MKRFLAFMGMLLVVLVLVACSSISKGTVTSKDYDPAWVQTVYDYHCIARNKDGLCTSQMPIPRQVYWPEKFTLNLKDGDKTGWVTVSGGEYEQYEVGDYYPRTEADDGF